MLLTWKKFYFILIFMFFIIQIKSNSCACTIMTAGKKATNDGSILNCNVSDSRTTRTWMNRIPHQRYPAGSKCTIYANTKRTVSASDLSALKPVGEIPQVAETYSYLNTAYPAMNEWQLTVTETTFGGPDTLRNKNALFTCEELCRMIMERAKTAREAIRVIDELTRQYGYNDAGEVLAIADKKEVWFLEIIGCGQDQIGAVWAARQVPPDHISVAANGSRILEIEPKNPDFMFSKNIYEVAEKYGLWSAKSGIPFRFAYIYGRESRITLSTRRREWRVFDILAPSLKLDPNGSDFPFSVKPDSLVTVEQMMKIFRDTFEGTDFDITKNILVVDKDGKSVKSPYANPFMDYDMMPLFKVNGGWGKMGERCIARYYCNYSIVSQIRDWLPDPIGGLVWHGYDNPAMTIFLPIFNGTNEFPAAYKISGRSGYNQNCAWWAYNRLADLTAQRWGDMRQDIDSVRTPLMYEIFAKTRLIEMDAVKIYRDNPSKAIQMLTEYTMNWGERLRKEWWNLGDFLWGKYTGRF